MRRDYGRQASRPRPGSPAVRGQRGPFDVGVDVILELPEAHLPLGAMDVVIAVTAIVAHPPFVDVEILARLKPPDVILILFDRDRAAGRATGANSSVLLEEPHTLLVQKILVPQGAHRAQVDDIARQFVIQGKPARTSISSWLPRLMTINSLVPLISRVKRTQRVHITQRSTNSVTVSPMSRCGW